MILFETVAVAFSMFSALPVPQVRWSKENMRYALCAFPLIGAVIGLLMCLWTFISGIAGLPELLRGAGYTLIPVLVTGGIHLDGYADTCDALASHAPAEKKQEILKDPHLGAFAAIRLCGYFILTFTLWASLKRFPAVPVMLSFVLTRALSGLAVASFPLAKNTGLAHTFATAADQKKVRGILGCASVALLIGLCLCGAEGIAMAVAAAAVFLWYRFRLQKQFGGLSGDLAGWFVQTAELVMLMAAVAVQYLEGMI